jgi:hypothetical protein
VRDVESDRAQRGDTPRVYKYNCIMPTFDFAYQEIVDETTGKRYTYNSLSQKDFANFSPSVLGLGDISREGKYVQALAAMYDLEGFTAFANQVDSHLVIPEFMKRYLQWLFDTLRTKFTKSDDGERVVIYGSLPFSQNLWEMACSFCGIRH